MQNIVKKINELGKKKIPFLFIIDYELKQPLVFTLQEIPNNILFDINGKTNCKTIRSNKFKNKQLFFEKFPVDKAIYKQKFDNILNHIKYGNSYLVNLTQPTPVKTNLSLEQIFYLSNAKYKLLYKNYFVVFSPEIFIQTKNNRIYSFPMKGTIDAAIPDAELKIMNDAKETAEHYTIVDLIRNDLSMISKNVKVNRFRYIDKIVTNNKQLLQVSSKISGELPENFYENIGDIIFTLLPAGSISGAPKRKTVEIISETEGYTRGYYTGIVGYFDGENIDSGVMIRFIEQSPSGFIYKSGGGITINSNFEKEYQELIDKVYVPFI